MLNIQNAIKTAPGAVLGPGREAHNPQGGRLGLLQLGNCLAPTKCGLGGAREMKGLKGERIVRSHPQRGEPLPKVRVAWG